MREAGHACRLGIDEVGGAATPAGLDRGEQGRIEQVGRSLGRIEWTRGCWPLTAVEFVFNR